MSSDALDGYTQGLNIPGTIDHVLQILQRWFVDMGLLRSALTRLTAKPTLLIWGSKDPIMEEPVRKTLRDALPGAKVKVFEGLGHNPFWEDPRGVAEVINAFLGG